MSRYCTYIVKLDHKPESIKDLHEMMFPCGPRIYEIDFYRQGNGTTAKYRRLDEETTLVADMQFDSEEIATTIFNNLSVSLISKTFEDFVPMMEWWFNHRIVEIIKTTFGETVQTIKREYWELDEDQYVIVKSQSGFIFATYMFLGGGDSAWMGWGDIFKYIPHVMMNDNLGCYCGTGELELNL
jgi:hypothetical protein